MAVKYSDSQWRDMRVQFARCGRSVWPRQHSLSRQWFQRCLVDFTFWFFFQGKGTLTDPEGNTFKLRPGVCLCMGPGSLYEVTQTEGDELGDVYIHADLYMGERKLTSAEWPTMPFYSEVINVNYFDQLSGAVAELVNNPFCKSPINRENDRLEAELLFKSLMLGVLRNHEGRTVSRNNGVSLHHEKKITTMVALLRENPLAFRNVSELAEFTGYSMSHFRAICHAVTGKKPSDLLIETRVERAKALLINSDMTVGMIAEALGYENVFYFSRQFKLMTGMTASEFRTNHS